MEDSKVKVIDGFLFFNEIEVLKLRLNYLYDVVDYFVILESNYTFSGKSKPYYLDNVINTIPQFIRNKIIRLKYEPDIQTFNFPKEVNECNQTNDHWKLENQQRRYFENALREYSPIDFFMLSDVDEIPRKEVVEKLISLKHEKDFCCVAKCEMLYYNFTTHYRSDWAGTIFTSVANALEKHCDYLRNQRFNLFSIDNGGWHFSYFGEVEKIKSKLESFSHQEYNKDRYKNEQNILDSINNKTDILHRGETFREYNFDNFPDNLRTLIQKTFPKNFYTTMTSNLTGATETSYVYLQQHYKFPDNVFVSHLPEDLKKSKHPYKILWAHHAYDQPVFLDFDHNIVQHIVSPSQWNKEMFIKYHNVPEYKITVIPNGVSDMFSYSDKKTKTMIFTSIPYKGIEVLAKVISLIHQIHPDTKFKIFSSMSLYGPMNDPYIEIYEHLKKMPNVEYSNAVAQKELVKHYQESAFFIHPCVWEETFCVSMAEAMRCGAYPIITNIGALAEVAGPNNASVVPIEGENTSKGWKVTDNFIKEFASACCMALDYYDKDKKFYGEVSKVVSKHVCEKYDWKTIASRWKNLIYDITGTAVNAYPSRYYCMISTSHTENYTDLAIDSFFKNTKFESTDKFFLIDNDGKYQLKQHFDKVTLISNNQPKSFAANMNLVMKLAVIDGADFFGLNNDVVFTKDWNQTFRDRNSISVPLCNQKLTGQSGSLNINSVMDIEDFGGKESELNAFARGIDPQKLTGDPGLIGFFTFCVPHEILSKVGFFDENFTNGAEDVDYSLRASQLGYEVAINATSFLLHFCGKSTWRGNENKEDTLNREKNYRDYFEKKWGKEAAEQLLVNSSVS